VCVSVCVCMCSPRYPACNTHATYFHLWPAWLLNIFLHFLINGTIFEKEITQHTMRVLIFSAAFV
jgi:hypothetical protein